LRQVALFDEGDVKGVEDSVSCRVPKAVSLRIGGITDEDTGNRTVKDFGIGCGDKSVSAATDLTEMGKRGKFRVP
jgi:hypothetical protein